MQLTHLRLVQFRNHTRSDVTPGVGVTVFVGGNAQGKSSLLEAVWVAATGRSFRAQRDGELIAFGAEWARVRAAVDRGGRSEEIDVALRREEPAASGGVAREIRVNGVPVQRGALFGHLLTVIAAPDDTAIVTGPPHRRRRVLDLLLAQISPAYFYALRRYARAVAQRNRLLRTRSSRGLEAWDEQVASLGAGITMRRRALVGRLAAAVAPVYRALSRRDEQLALEHAASLEGADEAAMVEAARDALARRRAEELARGVTLVGPHRDDLRLRAGGRELGTYGSRGEQLTAMLALRLAERRVLREETGQEPVLLFDDVLFVLDEERRACLLDAVQGAQALLTATAMTDVPRDAVVYRVRGGAVEAERAHRP